MYYKLTNASDSALLTGRDKSHWQTGQRGMAVGADLCSTLGARADDLCPDLGAACPLCWGRCAGGGRTLPARESGRITSRKIWIFYLRNHAFSCIFA